MAQRFRLGTLLVVSALLLPGCNQAAPVPPRVVLLLSMDTVRADFISADVTPAILDIARTGVVFPNAYAASSYTLPSHASMLTGLDPERHGLVGGGVALSPRVPTLAEAFTQAGYHAVGFHEGGYLRAEYGYARGFASWQELPRGDLVDVALSQVLDTLAQARERPLFLFLHTYAAHSPYGGYDAYRAAHPERGLPPAEQLLEGDVLPRDAADLPPDLRAKLVVYNQLKSPTDPRAQAVPQRLTSEFAGSAHAQADVAAIRRAYARRIAAIDGAVARVRDSLERLELWQDTLFVITSDHGEAFLEHGLAWHGFVPFDEVVRVPLVVSWPRALAGGRMVEGLVWHVDLAPTMLALAGVEAGVEGDGIDLSAALAGARLDPDREIFPLVAQVPLSAPRPSRRIALRGGLKWIEGDARYGAPGGLLFDLAADPGERRNLLRQRREAGELAASAQRWREGLKREEPIPRERDGGELERLRALGYVE